jgi:hypothetical protein
VFYETRELTQPPEDLDSVTDEEEAPVPEQTYKTRDMQAELKPAPRRRGRPRKKAPPQPQPAA